MSSIDSWKDDGQECLARFIIRSEWKALSKKLSSEEKTTEMLPFADSTALVDNPSKSCILHFAMNLGAPEEILKLLVERFPEDLTKKDEKGRTILHIACNTGTSPDFIFLCINANTSAAAAIDDDGKKPVHHLCVGYLESCSETVAKPLAEKRMKEILWMLYRNEPSSIISEDSNGVGTIEYALESDANIDFIKTLQHLITHFRENVEREKDFSKRRGVIRQQYPNRAQQRTTRVALAA